MVRVLCETSLAMSNAGSVDFTIFAIDFIVLYECFDTTTVTEKFQRTISFGCENSSDVFRREVPRPERV